MIKGYLKVFILMALTLPFRVHSESSLLEETARDKARDLCFEVLELTSEEAITPTIPMRFLTDSFNATLEFKLTYSNEVSLYNKYYSTSFNELRNCFFEKGLSKQKSGRFAHLTFFAISLADLDGKATGILSHYFLFRVSSKVFSMAEKLHKRAKPILTGGGIALFAAALIDRWRGHREKINSIYQEEGSLTPEEKGQELVKFISNQSNEHSDTPDIFKRRLPSLIENLEIALETCAYNCQDLEKTISGLKAMLSPSIQVK